MVSWKPRKERTHEDDDAGHIVQQATAASEAMGSRAQAMAVCEEQGLITDGETFAN